MSLLSRAELRKLIEHEQTFTRDDENETAVDSQVQPASFDVTVGRIYVPPELGDDIKGLVVERGDFYTLRPGAMALVLSREHIKLNSKSGGFVFPKNGDFALKGLLFTNFGHIDPGFAGHLKFTVINMGRHDFILRHGERIAGITLFQLTSPTEARLPHHSSSCETHARVLSRDFLDIETRIAKHATNSAKEEYYSRDRRSLLTTTLQMVLVLAVTAIGFIVTSIPTINGIHEKLAATNLEISKLQFQIDALKKPDQRAPDSNK